MNPFLPKLITLSALCLLLASCAQTGAPLPPSLELPKPPSDLRAIRKGNAVTLSWSEPTLTTDRQSVRYLGPTLICRSNQTEMTTCVNQVEIAPPSSSALQKRPRKSQQNSQPQRPTPQTYTDHLPASALSEDPGTDITYAVEVLNRNARGEGISNRVHVPAIATLPAPTDLSASLNDDGVLLTWTSTGAPSAKPGIAYRYRIYRRTEDASDQNSGRKKGKENTIAGEVAVGPDGPTHFLDPIEWEKIYFYRITAVTIFTRAGSEVQVEGDDSSALQVVAHDVFPPSVPAGLQAAYSGEGQKPFIDLIWSPVASSDLAGYNVFRSEANAAPAKLNSEPVKSPSYRDTGVSAGKTYTYSVSALDVRGNESQRSEQATEAVP
jgi:hypothetical protein